MNPINKVPLFLLLLIFLSSLSFATYVVYKVNFDIATNTIYFNMHGESTPGSSISQFGIADGLGTHPVTNTYITIYNTTTNYNVYGGSWNYYCWDVGTTRKCEGSGTITSTTELSCNSNTFINYIPMSNFSPRYDIASPTNCSAVYGPDWINVDNVYIAGTLSIASTLTKACQYCGYDAQDVCFYNNPNRVLNNPVGKYFFTRDDSTCIECNNGDTQCLNTTKDTQTCINNLWITTKTCMDGAFLDCGLNYSSQCPTPSVTITQPSLNSCSSNANCSANEMCACGFIPVTGGYTHETNCTMYNGSAAGQCRLDDGEPCTTYSQCASEACVNKDSTTGVGICGMVCTSDSNCSAVYKCASPQNLSAMSSYMQGDLVKYCFGKIGNLCNNNNLCYSQNCKPGCSGDNNRCVIPTYSCYCSSSSDCTGTSTACVVQNTTQPISNVIGQQVCITGLATGQSCSIDSQCGSNNCQNGYCCASGKLCCDSDSQCSGGQVCFTNSNWAAYIKYYTCSDKLGSGDYCQENKECTVAPCSGHLCSGTLISTTSSYTVSPSNYGSLPQNSFVNISLNYLLLDGTSVPATTICDLYVSTSTQIQATGTCASIFSINLTQIGEVKYRITAKKTGYQTQLAGYITINVYSPSSLKLNGQRCISNNECQGGKCTYMINGAEAGNTYTTRCWFDNECIGGTCIHGTEFYIDTGTSSIPCSNNLQCIGFNTNTRCDVSSGKCVDYGGCTISGSYMMCCSNNGVPCCDPFSSSSSKCTYNTACDSTLATCSIHLIPLGQECDLTSINYCASGRCLVTQTNASKGVCSLGAINEYGCNLQSDCQSNVFACRTGSYKCAQMSGSEIPGTQCSVNDQCISGTTGEEDLKMQCSSGTCIEYVCTDINKEACIFCYNTDTGGDNKRNDSYPTTKACHALNKTMGITCVYSCALSGGTNPSQPPSSTTTVPGTVNPEFLFEQLINLAFYTFIVAILFMIIALIVAGFTLAYSLIKR